MDEEETQNCPNCKRDIPSVNFMIHAVHCARNIRMCPVCKEPVPAAELDSHHQKFHKLLPCKQCGESVCGSDLEDHIRDSCGNTVKSCRFCSLELPRRSLPAHEAYCGVRTEQCGACREWVMLKYRQLHLDSNHGFVRLSDDPAPKEPSTHNIRRAARMNPAAVGYLASLPGLDTDSIENVSSTQAQNLLNGGSSASHSNAPPAVSNPGPANQGAPRLATSVAPGPATHGSPRLATSAAPGPATEGASGSASCGAPGPAAGGARKRTNDQPQINTNKLVPNKVDKHLPTTTTQGPVKKRPAPKPPSTPSANDSGPSGRPAPSRAAPPPGDPRRDMAYYSAMQRQQTEEKERKERNEYNLAHGLPPVLSPAAKIEKLRKLDALQNPDTEEEYRNRMRKRNLEIRDEEERRRQEFMNLKPMTPEQFMLRFNELQLRGDEGAAGAAAGGDRFSQIKSSLRELRRGLNEVTAPYNNNNANANNNGRGGARPEERLPCEFCAALVPPQHLVQHQTGCRPDLTQYRGPRLPASPPHASHAPHATHASHAPHAPSEPVIPCEFCTESLPIYLIAEHQERCARHGDIFSAD